ncbi:L,D-transpeptidase [Streptomyces sp. NPDC094466]|uniref:L,D-transpeptidase n=1 Tax=Streptomyces sp. NPDC094466 TaxID=3366065 RepID=UPI003805E9D0
MKTSPSPASVTAGLLAAAIALTVPLAADPAQASPAAVTVRPAGGPEPVWETEAEEAAHAEVRGPAQQKCTTSTGPYQREAEKHLGLRVDGKQSPSDCEAIADFQRRHEIEPDQGYAGLYTHRAIMWEQALAAGSRIKGCPDTKGVVVCIDKNRQILWVENAGRVVVKPVPARTGKPGYQTRSGWFKIYKREKKFWSTQFDGPMPFAQFFSGGQALHGSYRPIFEDPGSHGCVNLRYDDAKALWGKLRMNDAVYVWGTRTEG